MTIEARHVIAAFVVIAIPLLAIPTDADNQEDQRKGRQALRDLVDREQQAWDAGDAEALLACYTEDFMSVEAGARPNLTQWSQGHVSYTYKDLLEHTSKADWSNTQKASIDSEHYEHVWEVNHIHIGKSGEEAVLKTQMFWQNSDVDAGVIKQRSHSSVWMARKIKGTWQFHAAFGPVFAYNDEKPIPEEE